MILQCGKPAGSGRVFCEDFRTRQLIQSRGGAIVGCAVNGGISPTAASSRVTFAGTENVGINGKQMTIVLRFRTGAAIADCQLLSKYPVALNNNAFFVSMGLAGGSRLYMNTATSVADTTTYGYSTAWLANTEYHAVIAFNGLLAAASRIAMFRNGGSLSVTTNGTPPPALLACPSPVTAFNYTGGSTLAPPTDFILRSAAIYNTAWSAEEVLDDYQRDQYSELFGGG